MKTGTIADLELQELRDKASYYRSLATHAEDERVKTALLLLANDFDREANETEMRSGSAGFVSAKALGSH